MNCLSTRLGPTAADRKEQRSSDSYHAGHDAPEVARAAYPGPRGATRALLSGADPEQSEPDHVIL